MKYIVARFCMAFGATLFIVTGAYGAQVSHKKIKSGDTLYSLLKRYNFNNQQLQCALDKKKVPKDFTLVPKQRYRVTSKKNKTELKFFDNFYRRSYVFWRDGKKAGGCETRKENFRVEHVKVEGSVKGSIVSSIQKFLPDKQVAYRFLDAYVLDFNLPKVLQRGARFSFVVEKLFDGPHFVRYGEITRTEVDVKGKNEVRQYITNKGGGAFISPADNQKARPLYAPVEYVRISSTYQPRRLHPIKKRKQAHLGIDFELPEGEQIFTAGAGKVLRLGRTRGAGRYIVIRHQNGLESYYNHMQSIAKNLKKGSWVKNGQKIGTIGCTGYCTKPHLHFAVKRRGRFVDPAKYLKSYAFTQKPRVISFLKNIK